MPRLHIKEYAAALRGRTVFIAAREGVLRDHFKELVADIKFLTRTGVRTTFFHNLSNRFANQKHFSTLASRLPATRIVRAPADADFYDFVLNFDPPVHKIIFIERKYLIDHQGLRINTLTTQRARREFDSYAEIIANANFKGVIEQICDKINAGSVERVHILPAGRNTIKHELFTIEGSGTLIADNFEERFRPLSSEDDIAIIADILRKYKGGGFLKPRSIDYLRRHREQFFLVEIDGIRVGCCEKRGLDEATVELGAVAVSTRFRNQRVAVFLVEAFIDEMRRQGYRRVVSLTNNPRLAGLYRQIGFREGPLPGLEQRQRLSPNVAIFHRSVG